MRTVDSIVCFSAYSLNYMEEEKEQVMKKIASLMLVIVFMMSFGVVANAEVSEELEQVYVAVNEANNDIQEYIDEAVEESEEVIAEYENGDLTLDEKEEAIDAIVDDLLDTTNTIAAECKAEAEELGYDVICVLVEVMIDGRSVMVDPLIVGW